MIIYYVNIASKYIETEKWFFDCRCKVEDFLNKLKANLRFSDEEAMSAWKSLAPEKQEIAFENLYTVIRIDTDRCKKWKKLFKAKWYPVGKT